MIFRRDLPVLVRVLAGLTILVAGCDEVEEIQEVAPRAVLSMVVGDVDRFRVDSYPGRARAVREVNLGFEVSGKLITLEADVGSSVEQGEVLATVDPAPFVARIRALEGERA